MKQSKALYSLNKNLFRGTELNEILCDDYVKTHPYRYCRDICAERSFDKASFDMCVEECVKRVERECQ